MQAGLLVQSRPYQAPFGLDGIETTERAFIQVYLPKEAFPGFGPLTVYFTYKLSATSAGDITWRIKSIDTPVSMTLGYAASPGGTELCSVVGPGTTTATTVSVTMDRPEDDICILVTAESASGSHTPMSLEAIFAAGVWPIPDLPDPEPDPDPATWGPKFSGALVFDMRNPANPPTNPADSLGQWYTWNIPPGGPMGACFHRGAVHYINRDARVRREVEGQFFDDEDDAIPTRVTWAPWQLANLDGAQRVYRGHIDGVNLGGAGTVEVSANITDREFLDPAEWTAEAIDLADGIHEYEFHPYPQRGSAMQLTIEDSDTGTLTEGYGVKAITLEVGSAGKLKRIKGGSRI